MRHPRLVMDTSVLVAALRSRRGAAFRLLSLVGQGHFTIAVSVPLMFEYEATGRQHLRAAGLTVRDLDDILDYLARVADRRQIFYLWRPFLRDPKDDLVLELAVEANCVDIVTYNVRDFAGADQFGLRVVTPREFLHREGLLP